MKNYQVSLAKTYTVNIVAENEEKARHLVEFYTSDVQNISSGSERQAENSSIQTIERQSNDAIDCTEIDKD